MYQILIIYTPAEIFYWDFSVWGEHASEILDSSEDCEHEENNFQKANVEEFKFLNAHKQKPKLRTCCLFKKDYKYEVMCV